MKKIILSIFAITLVLGSGLVATRYALAEDGVQNPMSNLVQRIADKFGLNVDEVQDVFNQDRQERQTQMQTRFEERLAQDVTNGEITQEQKQLILEKRAELENTRQSNMENMEGLTQEERRFAMNAEREELRAWAEENGIDLKYVMGGFGMRGGHGGFGGSCPYENLEPSSDSTQS